jgi:hypothetical protein
MCPTDLEKESKHTIKADLHGGNTSAFNFLSLIFGNPLLAPRGQFNEFVECVIKPSTNEASVAGKDWTAFTKCRCDSRGNIITWIKSVSKHAQ